MNQSTRLSPEEFKAIVHGKGWTFKGLAEHWEMTPVWISNLSRNPRRPKHYDDAVMGLPAKGYLSRSEKTRKKIAQAYMNEQQAKLKHTSKAYRYFDYLKVGSIVTVMEDVGSLAEVGERGCVFQVRTTGDSFEYGVIFQSGTYDWFLTEYVDKYIVQTGLEDNETVGFKYTSEEQLKRVFAEGKFNFFP